MTLAKQLSDTLGFAKGEIALLPEIRGLAAVMTLGGRASEAIARNRGKSHNVVPLCAVTEDVFAWSGYRELWQKESADKNFRFVEGGFTLHIGRQGELAKPQILRSEWVGRRNGAFGNQAGHPHWQLDVLESARTRPRETTARFDDTIDERAAVDFGGEPRPMSGEDLIFGLTIERVHLASAALWWKQPSIPVAHPAETVADLDRWVLGCVSYLRQELGRCAIVGGRASFRD